MPDWFSTWKCAKILSAIWFAIPTLLFLGLGKSPDLAGFLPFLLILAAIVFGLAGLCAVLVWTMSGKRIPLPFGYNVAMVVMLVLTIGVGSALVSL